MTATAIYARVSSQAQAQEETIGSQLDELRRHAEHEHLHVPEDRVFADDGHSGATLARPALEALRDLAARGCVDVVLVYSPDRLARKLAYQALLMEEFSRCGVRTVFVKGPRGDSPEDQMMIQFQGMFAEYEKAQIIERSRRGKAWRARTGSVSALSGAPYGYRYVRKTPREPARYEIVGHEAALVAELFRRYADDGASLDGLRRWLEDQGAPTRTGKDRWDKTVIRAMLRNPAYAGTAAYGKTRQVPGTAALTRPARLQGRTVPRQTVTRGQPEQDWTGIPVPAIISQDTFDRVQQQLKDNKRFAAPNAKVPSLLQGLASCAACGHAVYRTSAITTTAGRKLRYYRCRGTDGRRVCPSKPVRADYLDRVVWDHVTGLIADPALIRAEIARRLEQARTADPATRRRGELDKARAKTAASIASLISALSEQLITIDELRDRMPALRTRETALTRQIEALDAQAADRDAHLKLAGSLEGFLARLREGAQSACTEDRQRVLRALVQDVLVGPEKITIRHRIPVREHTASGGDTEKTDTEGDMRTSSPLRWGRGAAHRRQHSRDRPGRRAAGPDRLFRQRPDGAGARQGPADQRPRGGDQLHRGGRPRPGLHPGRGRAHPGLRPARRPGHARHPGAAPGLRRAARAPAPLPGRAAARQLPGAQRRHRHQRPAERGDRGLQPELGQLLPPAFPGTGQRVLRRPRRRAPGARPGLPVAGRGRSLRRRSGDHGRHHLRRRLQAVTRRPGTKKRLKNS